MNSEEADAVFVVGGDGSLGRVVSGMMENPAPLPLGAFPAGRRNWALRSLWASALDSAAETLPLFGEFRDFVLGASISDVRWACESAMALIREERRRVAVVETEAEGQGRRYGLGLLHAGELRHVDERRWLYWLLGPLRHYFALGWAALWRSPKSCHVEVEWEEACEGCASCLPPPAKERGRWWGLLTPRRVPKPDPRRQRTNPTCGASHVLSADTAELLGEADLVKGGGELRLSLGPERLGRLGLVWEGLSRHLATPATAPAKSSRDGFYAHSLSARFLGLRFSDVGEGQGREKLPTDEEVEEAELLARVNHYSFDLRSQEYLWFDPYTPRPLPLGLDGDALATPYLRLRLVPDALTFYIPSTFSLPSL